MNKLDKNNTFEKNCNEMTETFQSQFSAWMKMSEDYFEHMNDFQTKMFQSLQKQCGIANESAEQSLKAQKPLANNSTKEKVKTPDNVSSADMIEGNWKDLMGDVQKQWSKLTNDNLDQINGSREKLANTIQKNYSIAREEAEKQMEDWEKTRTKILKNTARK